MRHRLAPLGVQPTQLRRSAAVPLSLQAAARSGTRGTTLSSSTCAFFSCRLSDCSEVVWRTGGRAVGALYLWCARILAAAEAEKDAARRVVEQAEVRALQEVLERSRSVVKGLEEEQQTLQTQA